MAEVDQIVALQNNIAAMNTREIGVFAIDQLFGPRRDQDHWVALLCIRELALRQAKAEGSL